MQPALQVSTEFLYLVSKMMISGARYDLDITWFERLLFSSCRFGRTYSNFSVIASRLQSFFFYSTFLEVLARPKSQSRSLQSWSSRILPGLRSLCMTFALWRKSMAQSSLNRMVIVCFSLSPILSFKNTFRRSLSMQFMTMNMSFKS